MSGELSYVTLRFGTRPVRRHSSLGDVRFGVKKDLARTWSIVSRVYTGTTGSSANCLLAMRQCFGSSKGPVCGIGEIPPKILLMADLAFFSFDRASLAHHSPEPTARTPRTAVLPRTGAWLTREEISVV
jgi:hypothetical protein